MKLQYNGWLPSEALSQTLSMRLDKQQSLTSYLLPDPICGTFTSYGILFKIARNVARVIEAFPRTRK